MGIGLFLAAILFGIQYKISERYRTDLTATHDLATVAQRDVQDLKRDFANNQELQRRLDSLERRIDALNSPNANKPGPRRKEITEEVLIRGARLTSTSQIRASLWRAATIGANHSIVRTLLVYWFSLADRPDFLRCAELLYRASSSGATGDLVRRELSRYTNPPLVFYSHGINGLGACAARWVEILERTDFSFGSRRRGRT
jgi:hypothetical protein